MLLARIYVLHQREHLMKAVENRISSHTRRVKLGIAGNLSDVQLAELRSYWEALRDILKQPGFPHTVEYPQTPLVLRPNIIG